MGRLCRILNYDDCRLHWKSCRSPSKGKPMGVVGTRLFKEGDTFIVFRYNEHVATIGPDNVLTLRVMPQGSLQWALHRIFHLGTSRKGKGKYDVYLRRTPEKDGNYPRFFPGIRFDMFSHQCVNEQARPLDPVRVKDAARELEWQRKLRRYVKGWKVRDKIGALANSVDEHLKRVISSRRRDLRAEQLISIVETEDYGEAAAVIVLNALTWYQAEELQKRGAVSWLNSTTSNYNYWQRPPVSNFADIFDRVYRRHRENIYTMLGIVQVIPQQDLNPAL